MLIHVVYFCMVRYGGDDDGTVRDVDDSGDTKKEKKTYR